MQSGRMFMFPKPKQIPQCRLICDFFARQSSGSSALNSLFHLWADKPGSSRACDTQMSSSSSPITPGAFGESANLTQPLARQCPCQSTCVQCLHMQEHLCSAPCRSPFALIHPWKQSITSFISCVSFCFYPLDHAAFHYLITCQINYCI